jgi:hypothetical protein
MRNRPLVALLLVCVCCAVVFNVNVTNWLQDHADGNRLSIDGNDFAALEQAALLPTEPSISKRKPLDGHVIAGLSCEKYGGPSEESAAEMVYWRDIPTDTAFASPFSTLSSSSDLKYLTFEPDEGGWNNMRMAMETAVLMAHAMGRILVLVRI